MTLARAPAPRTAPGPRGVPLFGSLHALLRDPLGEFQRMVQRYGDVVRFRIGPRPALLIHLPQHVEHVLVEGAAKYRRGRTFRSLEPLLGKGILTNEGEAWRRSRRSVQPLFHKEGVQLLVDQMVEVIAESVERLAGEAHSGPVDITGEVSKLTLSIVTRTLFRVDLPGGAATFSQVLPRALDLMHRRVLSLVQAPMLVPTPANRRLARAVADLDVLVLEVLRRRREEASSLGSGDLLGSLLAYRSSEVAPPASDHELRNEVLALILAGHETAATTLSWVLYLLARFPAEQETLRNEVAAVLGGRRPTASELPHLRYTSAVVEEALRLYPPVWCLTREAVEADEVAGYAVPRGCSVFMATYLTHRCAEAWPSPERFEPARFLDGGGACRRSLAYLPFGAGQHKCVGAAFALTEVTLAVAMIVGAFRLRLPAAARDIEPIARLTLRPGTPVRLLLQGLHAG